MVDTTFILKYTSSMSEEKNQPRYLYYNLPKKQILWNNFLGGITWGIGATVGVAVLLTILGFIASKANLIPFIGNFVSDLLNYVLQHNPHFAK